MPDERRFAHLLGGEIHVRGAGADDEEIAGLAHRQLGVVARSQLLNLGIGTRAIEHRLAVGRLRPLHRGVFAVGHEALTHSGRVLAAVMSASPGAGASRFTAAALWGLCDPPRGPIHVTAEASRRPRPGTVVHRGILPAADLALVDGIPVTSVARVLLDLAGGISQGRLRRLVKQAEFMGLVDAEAIAEILARHPRRRGRGALVRVAADGLLGAGRTRSELEDRFLRFCAERRLPPPETNVVLETRGGTLEVDCLWRTARLVVELDGRRAHGGGQAFEDDRARDRALAAAGWTPVRITWRHLHRDADTLETELRDALMRRSRDERRFHHRGGGEIDVGRAAP